MRIFYDNGEIRSVIIGDGLEAPQPVFERLPKHDEYVLVDDAEVGEICLGGNYHISFDGDFVVLDPKDKNSDKKQITAKVKDEGKGDVIWKPNKK